MNNNNNANKYTNNLRRGRNEKIQKEEEKGREKISIEIEPETFVPTTDGKLITVSDLALKINAVFKPIIPDFKGSAINVGANGSLETILYFYDNTMQLDEGQIKAMQNLNPTSSRGMSQAAFINAHNNSFRKNRYYRLTDDVRDILEPFLGFPQGQKVSWNGLEIEQSTTRYAAWNAVTTVIAVQVSLQKLVEVIWGRKNTKGERVDYMLNVIRPLGDPTGNSMASNWLLQISRYNNKELMEMASKCGLIASDCNIPMYEA